MSMTHPNEALRLLKFLKPTQENNVHPSDIVKETGYQLGRLDRMYNKPCASAYGPYLDGWYGVGSGAFYFLLEETVRGKIQVAYTAYKWVTAKKK